MLKALWRNLEPEVGIYDLSPLKELRPGESLVIDLLSLEPNSWPVGLAFQFDRRFRKCLCGLLRNLAVLNIPPTTIIYLADEPAGFVARHLELWPESHMVEHFARAVDKARQAYRAAGGHAQVGILLGKLRSLKQVQDKWEELLIPS